MAIWIVEYSPKQGAFNVHEAGGCIAKNLKMLERCESDADMSGYIPIGIASSHEEASQIAKEMKVAAVVDSWPGIERRFGETPDEPNH